MTHYRSVSPQRRRHILQPRPQIKIRNNRFKRHSVKKHNRYKKHTNYNVNESDSESESSDFETEEELEIKRQNSRKMLFYIIVFIVLKTIYDKICRLLI